MVKKGLASKAPVDGFDFNPRDGFLVGEEARETLLMPEMIEGVRGVFASERERRREGVFGGGIGKRRGRWPDANLNHT